MRYELVMIVKNSGKSLKKTLEEASKWLDKWTILDTGSTDGTQDLIKNTLDPEKGNLHECKFVDFSQARNQALDLASDNTIHVMLDDTYIIENPELLKSLPDGDAWTVEIHGTDSIYSSTRIFDSSAHIRYEGRVHELPTVVGTRTKIKIIDDPPAEHLYRTQCRLGNDIRVLRSILNDNNDDHYRRMKLIETLSAITRWESLEDPMVAEIIKHSKILEDVNEFSYRAGLSLVKIRARITGDLLAGGEMEKLAKKFPDEGEPQMYIAVYYRNNKDVNTSYNWIIKAMNAKPSHPISRPLYEREIPYFCADISISGGRMNMAEKVLKDSSHNDMRLANMILSISNIPQPPGQSLGPPTVVIHSGRGVRGWNPYNFVKGCSGSEFMASAIAHHLGKIGYRVFVFGDFQGDDYDSTGAFSGVQYIDHSHYWGFLMNYKVDILLVSRDVSNLVYLNNVGKVYLWLHDVLPFNSALPRVHSVQYHATKFKKVMCLCDWHAKYVSKAVGITPEWIYVTRNSIPVGQFLRERPKKSNKFIYASSADRGLEWLLECMSSIKTRIPDAELHIYCDIERTMKGNTKELKDAIDSMDYVYHHGRVQREIVINEFLSSDVWFYPTDFTETYCITAVEAQAAGLLCACFDIGSLGEVVGERGIVIPGSGENKEDRITITNKLCDVLQDIELKSNYQKSAREWGLLQSHEKLAKDWSDNLFSI